MANEAPKTLTYNGLERFRLRMDMTRTELADRLGCDPKTLRRYLSGETPIPQYIALGCAALAYGLRPMVDGAEEESEE